MSLIQVIYVSTAAPDLNEKDLRRILDASMTNNARLQITGMLLYSCGTFMQVLEGEESAVKATMDRVRGDSRHHDVNLLSSSRVDNREFSNWTMGFRELTAGDAATWPGYAPFFESGFSTEMIGARPGLAFEILKALAGQE